MGAGSRAPHADEQPRSRRRGASAGSRGVWRRTRQSRARLGVIRRDRGARFACWRTTRRYSCSRATGRRIHDAPRCAACAHRQRQPRRPLRQWEVFRDLERRGLIMYGQMTAGSWIYIGTQESCKERSKRWVRWALAISVDRSRPHRSHGWLGRHGWRATAGGHHDEGICLAVEVDPSRVERRLQTRYLDRATSSVDEALAWCEDARRRGSAMSSAWSATAPMSCRAHHPRLCSRVVTDKRPLTIH